MSTLRTALILLPVMTCAIVLNLSSGVDLKMGSEVSHHGDSTSGTEFDGEGSESDGSVMNISWLFAQSSVSDTSVGSDEEGRLEQLQVEYDLQDESVDESFQSALGEAQFGVVVETEKLRDREIERVKSAIARERSVRRQLNFSQAQLDAEYPLGTRVKVNDDDSVINVSGTVRYVGELKHRREVGMCIGVELDQPKGKHNGTVGGVEYFRCPDKCGIFVRRYRVSRIESSKSEAVEVVKKTEFPPKSTSVAVATNHASPTVKSVENPTDSDGRGQQQPKLQSQVAKGTPVEPEYPPVGARVEVAINDDDLVSGTVMFVGKISYCCSVGEFDTGVRIGVALDEPYGYHNGTVRGVKYFHCQEDCGILVLPEKVRIVGKKPFGH